jgi:ABC-type phosphate/phosphonate transport system substrate-binding protein
MLLPMGFLIGNGYANVVGDSNDIESLRNTVTSFFSEDASIPDSGTTYYGYSGAVRCLSEGVGSVAFAKDSTVAGYCGNEDAAENEDWCLPEDDYVLLPSYGSAPSHPVMYNPEFVTNETKTKVQDALVAMKDNDEGAAILDKILGTPGIVTTDAETHLGSYGVLIGDIPGISTYYDTKYEITS